MTQLVRLKDIAEAAGVSIDTVSRALNGKSLECWPSTAKKADRIREIARKLNYTPNRAAQMMRTNRTKQIGVLVSELYNPGTGLKIEMAEDYLAKKGYTLVLGLFPPGDPRTLKDAEKFTRNLLDGVLNFVPLLETKDLKLIAPRIPIITFNRSPQESPAILNLREAVTLGMEHLWSLGHRKIALITAMGVDKINYYYDRVSGYEAFYASQQIASSPSWIVPSSGWRSEDGLKAVDNFLATGCTACIAGNDLIAVGLSSGLKARGYEIPKNYSIVSIDDTLLTSIHYPALTALHEPSEDLIRATIDALIDVIEGRPAKPCEILSAQLIVRNSTAPLPAT